MPFSINAEDIAYIPRSDREVMEDLSKGNIPLEIKELKKFVDTIPAVIKEKIEAILDRILSKNNRNRAGYKVNIQVFLSSNENASTITGAKEPLLNFSTALLKNVQSEDELAGVIAHELGHIILHEADKTADHINKVEETAADNLGVQLLARAGYNPNGIIDFFKRAGESESHLISLDDIHNAESYDKSVTLITNLADEHPASVNRIRAMQTTITALSRAGSIPPFEGTVTALPQAFYQAVDLISYKIPLDAGLEKIGYQTKSILEKLNILTTLLKSVYPATNNTLIERQKLLAQYIKNLQVDFKDAEQIEGFKCLCDVLMVQNPVNDQNMPSYKNEELLVGALKNVWQQGGKDPRYLGRFDDLQNALERFVHATTELEAEQSAAEIVQLGLRFNLVNAPCKLEQITSFKVPKEKEIRKALVEKGQWIPPYANHLSWYLKSKSQNIKHVGAAMRLYEDPWVMAGLNDDAQYKPAIYWLDWRANTDDTSDVFDNYKSMDDFSYFKLFQRDALGTISGLVQQIPAYSWNYLAKDASKDAIIASELIELENKKHYEEQILQQIDWSLLKSDFSVFIIQYGKLLNHPYTLLPMKSPFADKFYAELTKNLLSADKEYAELIKDFFRRPQAHKHPLTVYRYQNLCPSDLFLEKDERWPYENIEKPNQRDMNNPLIKFILNQEVNSVIADDLKELYLRDTRGFMQTDTSKKLCELFAKPWNSILNKYPPEYDSIKSLNQGYDVQEINNSWYAGITFLLQLERLAYENQDSMSLQEYILLDSLLKKISINDYVQQSNLSAFLADLKIKTLTRSLNNSDAKQLVKDYRLAVAYGFLVENPSLANQYLTRIKMFLKELDSEGMRHCLFELFKPEIFEKNEFHDLLNKTYDGYIPDPDFRNWAIELYTDVLAKILAKDEANDKDYLTKTKAEVDTISQNTTGFTQFTIISSLAEKLNAQKELAYYMRDLCKMNSLKTALSNRYMSVIAELLLNESTKSPILRWRMVDFLKQPLTADSPEPLKKLIINKYNYILMKLRASDKSKEEILLDTVLRDYHRNFRASPLELKTLYLEPLLFPINATEAQQLDIIQDLIEEVFPSKPANSYNAQASLIVRAYLNAAGLNERRLLATAMFVANIREDGAAELSVGSKLNLILSNMGPAGGKLLQAIHSHPQTPDSIKKELEHSKTSFSKPLRWDLVELVDKSALLDETESNQNPVSIIGRIVGSGSFGVTVFNTLKDGTKVADTFLRENAAVKAEREFAMMQKAAAEIVTTNKDLAPIVNMVEEARRSAVAETAMDLAEVANQFAVKAYHKQSIQVGYYKFEHQVAEFKGRGTNFKRISIAQGEHFNDLSKSPYKEAIAKAVLVTQLSARLSAINTDLDRHGGNLKVTSNIITHFDFGAMNLDPITQEDKIITGKVLAQAIYAGFRGGDFMQSLLNSIQQAQVSAKTRVYLNGLNKDFLALGDYMNTLESADLSSILAYCLTAASVDPQIKAEFNAELGNAIYVIEPYLKWKALKAGVKVVTDTNPVQSSHSTVPEVISSGARSVLGFFESTPNSAQNNFHQNSFSPEK
ncbi:MAG: M48 family metallopeptidase [Legionella sp.]|jgi:hypothetical protein